jgi:MoxR-like ATPase
MRAVFSRIGSKISCDANTVTGFLICAALIGRRVFIFAALVLAGAGLAKRFLKHDVPAGPVPAEAPTALSRPSSDAAFRPPHDYRSIAVPDLSPLHDAMSDAIVGQRAAIDTLVLALVAGGHALLEGAPGLAKTLACRTMAAAIDASFSRIQCTADLSPADIVGSEIFDQRDLSFRTRRGPIFANVVLADEINRAPARTQAALLEALEEGQVTIACTVHRLPDPFFVLATMNEAEADGIYALGAAQADRFLLKEVLDFPDPHQDLQILDRAGGSWTPNRRKAVSIETVRTWRESAAAIYCAPRLREYVVALVRATRDKGTDFGLECGAGPRGALAMLRAARAKAMLAGRSYVLPADVRSVAPAALRHRISFSPALLLGRGETEDRLKAIVDAVPLP